jgi:FkbM family methyltransferase
MYYGLPWRAPAWRHFYGTFISPGDLVFDVGAHVGSRTAAMLAIGARVVAVEPQPLLAATLGRLYGRKSGFTLLATAIGDQAGRAEMLASSRTPTVSTLSADWIDQVTQTRSFSQIRWDQRVQVDVTTLDALITEFGIPSFCKIDIEGNELEALKGLTQMLPALSFEYLPPSKDRAIACVNRLREFGPYSFNVIRAEYPRFALADWVSAEVLCDWLNDRDLNDRAGEVYARIEKR